MVDKTRRELLAEAFDKSVEEEAEDDIAVVEGSGEPLEEDVGSGVEAEPDLGSQQVSKDDEKADAGRKTPKVKEVGKKPAPAEAEKQEAEAARQDAEGKPVKEPALAPTDKAPNSWKPAVREAWAKIPSEARAEITRREREIQTTLSQTANIRKFAGDFAAVINPFSHLIRAQNSTPLHAVQNLMTTAAGLMTGNDEQRAGIVAEIIQNYGVDVEVLDNILHAIAQKNGGKIPKRNGAAPQEGIPTWARPIVASHQRMEQLQQQHEQRMQQEADQEIASVEDQPYFDDLRDDIADIMEIAANRGRKMTVKDAYTKAVQLNPEISKLVSQARTQVRQNTGKQVMTRARRAASTIAGSPNTGRTAGAKKGGEPKSRREQLIEAWDEATDA